MQITTSRFGPIQIDPDRLLAFPRGLVGFADATRFVLLDAVNDVHHQPLFWWLQSVDHPALSFFVTDPKPFLPDYRVTVPANRYALLDLEPEEADAAHVLVVVNKHGDQLTANLQGPLVINGAKKTGLQLISSEAGVTTRVPLLRLNTQDTDLGGDCAGSVLGHAAVA